MRTIETTLAPAAIGPYAQAIVSGGLVFTSGQLPIDPVTGAIPSDIEGQSARSNANLEAVLEAAGSGLDRVVKTTCFLKNMGDFAVFNAVYARSFPGKPARSCVEAAALPKGVLVEIEAVAEVN